MFDGPYYAARIRGIVHRLSCVQTPQLKQEIAELQCIADQLQQCPGNDGSKVCKEFVLRVEGVACPTVTIHPKC